MQQNIYDPKKPFNEQIRQLIRATHPKEGPLKIEPHGKRFLKVMDSDYWKNFDSQDATDGIGTKGLLHWRMGTLPYGVQDAFAMVVDDLMEGGFVPVHLQDHILMQEEDEEKIFTCIRKLRDLCLENPWQAHGESYPIAITGGETAIINTLQGFEMGITATGYVREGGEVFPDAKDGDVVIGLKSNGVHSNGLSFYRQELFDKRNMKLDGIAPWNSSVTIGEELTRPTHVYMPALKELLKQLDRYVFGMVHITGGGLSKLRELISPDGRDIDINITRAHRLAPQEIFFYAQDFLGVSPENMYTRFNNGVGYAIVMERSNVDGALAILRRHFPAEVIGDVTRGKGRVVIESQYSPTTITFQ